jgi:hypothetical protein
VGANSPSHAQWKAAPSSPKLTIRRKAEQLAQGGKLLEDLVVLFP